jgi:LysM repeat protein
MKNTTLALLFACHFLYAQNVKKADPKPNQKPITHTVAAKETLFSLLKKYNNTEETFLKLNPGFDKTLKLKLGQTLVFKPTEKLALTVAKSTSIKTEVKPQVKEKIIPATTAIAKAPVAKTNTSEKQRTKIIVPEKGKKQVPLADSNYHTVQANETIFSLSKKYDLDINEFVVSNDLSNNVIKPGQKLLINKLEIKKLKEKIEKKPEPVYVQKQVGKRIIEEGVAEVVQTKNRTHKFLALHRTAKKGSVIKVTNEANGEAIYAKIVGNLHKVGPDQNIMLKLSPLAYYRLKPKDSQMRAKIEYYSPM